MEEKMTKQEKERQKALKTIRSRNINELTALAIEELDKRNVNPKINDIKPALTDEERTALLQYLYDNATPKSSLQFDRYFQISAIVVHIEKAFERLSGEVESLAFHVMGLEMMEMMETAVNTALIQIQDYDKRKQTALGIAKHVQLYACSQSVDEDGLLVLSTTNKGNKYIKHDEQERLHMAAQNLELTIRTFKAAVEAILDTIKKWNLWNSMAATRKYIGTYTTSAEAKCSVFFRYYDVQSMYSFSSAEKRETPQEAIDSGRGLLYDSYRAIRWYNDIKADEEVKRIILENYIRVADYNK